MQSLYNLCCGSDSASDESRNKPVYKDGTFWTMLGVLIAAMILTSLVAVSSKLMKYDERADSILKRGLFFIPVPEWTIPIIWLGLYVLYFLATYLTFRKINANTCITPDQRRKSKSYMWMLYIVFLSANFLWSWTYLGMGEHMIAFVFLAAVIAALVCQMVLAGNKKWGGEVKGAWFMFLPFVIYLGLIALPLNFSSAFFSDGKHEKFNMTIRKNSGEKKSFLPSKLRKNLDDLAI